MVRKAARPTSQQRCFLLLSEAWQSLLGPREAHPGFPRLPGPQHGLAWHCLEPQTLQRAPHSLPEWVSTISPRVLAQMSRENSQQVEDNAFRGADRVGEGLQRETEKGHGHSRSCSGLARSLPRGPCDFSLCPSLSHSSPQPGLGAHTEVTPTSLPPQKLPAQTGKYKARAPRGGEGALGQE